MGSNIRLSENLPDDIQTELQKHDLALRLSYAEIVSGISRLSKQGIPKEVISQVIMQTVEAVLKNPNREMSQEIDSPRSS